MHALRHPPAGKVALAAAGNLLASEANSQFNSRSKTKSVTVGAALAGTVGSQITRAYDMAKAAQEGTGNRRLDGALALKAIERKNGPSSIAAQGGWYSDWRKCCGKVEPEPR